MRAALKCSPATALLLFVLVGCGGGSAAGDGAAGVGGTATGIAGTTGTGGNPTGSGGAGGFGDPTNLPACAITTRPSDPVNPEGGSPIDSTLPNSCSSINLDGAWVTSECFVMVNGGWQQDGGGSPVVVPEGGTIRDGDYDMVRWLGSNSTGECLPVTGVSSTNRRIRIFGGGTFIEWAAMNRDTAGNESNFWYNTTNSVSGHTLMNVGQPCGGATLPGSYGYTASGDDFTYFRYSGGMDGSGDLTTVVTYHRTCRR